MTNWVDDSVSTDHVVKSREHMYNTRYPNGYIVVGDGNSVKVELVWDIDILVKNRDGSKVIMTLKYVWYTPKMWANLFSITKELISGINISNDGETLILIKGNKRIEFFDKFGGVKGYIGGINAHTVENINDC